MIVKDFLEELARRGVRLMAHGDQLAVEAPSDGALTPELWERIRAAKPALLAALAGSPAKPSQPAPPGWDDRTAAELVAEADGMVAAVGVDGSHPRIQEAAAVVMSALQARDMAALRLALDEFRDAVRTAAANLFRFSLSCYKESVLQGVRRMKIDLSLKNLDLYSGCQIEEVAGRANLTTPVADAVNIVGRNIAAIVAATPQDQRREVTLTGPMAVWAYLVVFHSVVHSFSKVYYDDGRNGPVLVAAHG